MFGQHAVNIFPTNIRRVSRYPNTLCTYHIYTPLNNVEMFAKTNFVMSNQTELIGDEISLFPGMVHSLAKEEKNQKCKCSAAKAKKS